MRVALLLAAAYLAGGNPTHAVEPSGPIASSSYNPWVAAGLTYVPVVPASVAAAFTTGITSPTVWLNSGSFMAVNPMPGLGHLYVGEPVRGLGFFGTGMGLLLATVGANVSLYRGMRLADSPLTWQDQVRDGVNLTYLATSTALSLWAAWDAYRVAEAKNNLALQPTP